METFHHSLLSEDVLSPATHNVESTGPSPRSASAIARSLNSGVDVIHYGTDRFLSWILPRISGQYNLSVISCRNLVLDDLSALHHKFDSLKFGRSEERRVGKECRWRWWLCA